MTGLNRASPKSCIRKYTRRAVNKATAICSQLRSQEKYYRDRLSEIADAEDRGIKKGLEQGLMESAQGMIKLGLDDEAIMQITGFSLEVVQALRQEV